MADRSVFAGFVKRNVVLLIFAFVALLISVSYAAYVTKVAPDKTWDVATSFITTVLSIVLGAVLSIMVYNFQIEQQDREKLLELKSGIKAEIADILDVLSRGESLDVTFQEEVFKFVVTYIQPVFLESAASSNLFDSVSTENFLHVARKIRFYNVHVSHFLNLLSNLDSPSTKELIKRHQANMDTTRLAIIDNLTHLLRLL